MRIWVQIAVFILGLGAIQGQDFSLLDSYLETAANRNQYEAKDKISKLVSKLNSKSSKPDRQFLMGLFGLTHRQLLKEYQQYSEFNDIFDKGYYDCVTATALYSLVLAEFDFKHTILETKYHIFIIVESEEGRFLIESTDPIGGFEFQQEKIDHRIARYLQDEALLAGQLNTSKNIAPINKITPHQLTGLLFYNQSVRHFNENQLELAASFLSKAKLFYHSPRMQEMESILQSQQALSAIDLTGTNLIQRISQRHEP